MGWSDSGDGSSDISEYTAINTSAGDLTNKKDVRRHPCTYEGCKLIFTRPHRLAAHLRVHTGEKPFPCGVIGCQKAYTNKSHLSRHIKSTHQLSSVALSKSYSCSKCPYEFSTNQNLKKHVLRKHNKEFPYWCETCQTGFKKKNRLTAHMFLHTGINPFKCDSCTETFPTVTACNKHRRNHRSYKCFCGQDFKRWTEILKHRKLEHVCKEYHCDVCKKIFKLKRSIQSHMKVHCIPDQKNVYPCPHDCSKFYSTKFNLFHHIRTVHEGMTFNCSFPGCSAKLATKDKLDQHFAKHGQPTRKPKQPRQRNKRKDIGKIKRSSAVRLAGVKMPITLEKYIIDGKDIPIVCLEDNQSVIVADSPV